MLKLLPQLSEVPVLQMANQAESAPAVKPVMEVKAGANPEVVVEVKAEVKQEVKAETRQEVKQEVKAETRPEVKPEVKTEAATEKGKPILADKFSAGEKIGEKASSVKQDEVITSAMHNKPISDIGAAIGINDKFYFIRELFSGDTRAYQETIKRLNSSASLGEAMKILDENTVMGTDPAAQSSFVDVVRRKFNINV
jgi:hypothetical protein